MRLDKQLKEQYEEIKEAKKDWPEWRHEEERRIETMKSPNNPTSKNSLKC